MTSSAHRASICLALLALAGASCRHADLPGAADLPPGVAAVPGAYQDIAPRWSRDGSRIAFVRATSDRRHQLCVASGNLSGITPLIAPETVSPDRDMVTSRIGLRAPEAPAWSPDGGCIAFSRIERFKFDDGEQFPGLSIWACNTRTARTDKIAVHPRKYDGTFHYFRSPSWSPTGRYFALMGEGVNGETGLSVRPASGGAPDKWEPRYDTFADTDWPTWAPASNQLVFRQGILRGPSADRYDTLRLIEPGGNTARRLLTVSPATCRGMLGLPANAPVDPRLTAPAVSPDGSALAFALWPDPLDSKLTSIWTMSLRSTPVLTRVSPADGLGYTAPTWIDRSRIGATQIGPRGLHAVVLGSAVNKPVTVLCPLPSGDYDWSPDRSAIVCAGPAYTGTGARPATTLRILPTSLHRPPRQ